MPHAKVPIEKIRMLREKICLTGEDCQELTLLAPVFLSRKRAYAERFYRELHTLPDAQLILDHVEDPSALMSFWVAWFERLFSNPMNDQFIAFLWHIGKRHVDVNVDQRLTNLGFSMVRQFCYEAVRDEVPPERQLAVFRAVDKVLDLCTLVVTDAYVDATTRCDLEVVKGISDRIRNPVTVIGGHLKRIRKKLPAIATDKGIFDSIIAENEMLERMVEDIRTYISIFKRDQEIRSVPVRDLIDESLSRLFAGKDLVGMQVSVNISPDAAEVEGDPYDLRHLFYYLLQNSVEAVDPFNPYISITSRPAERRAHTVHIEIFNTGKPPGAEEIKKLFSPFYSTKTRGTGFGLAIAQLAARRQFGKLAIIPLPGEGTKLIVTLAASVSGRRRSFFDTGDTVTDTNKEAR